MFYLFFPLIGLLLFRGGRAGRWTWIALTLTLFALGPFARVVWSKNDLQAENSYLAGMASIAVGCLTAYLVDQLSHRRMRTAWLRVAETAGWAGILLIAVWPRWTMMRTLGRSGTDDALLALSVCLVMAAVTLRRKPGSRWSAPLRWFGRHSYELYLSHEFVVIAGVAFYARHYSHQTSRGVVAAFAVTMLLLTAPLAWVLARWFTEPANRRLRGATMVKPRPAEPSELLGSPTL
ncbi:MAG TPA: acyltransferase family protein [Acidobacteriaceae bacterium]|nr:acyltransferase family protein [Acidobacteriaceae bacterium]